jgi:hypothetical protein
MANETPQQLLEKAQAAAQTARLAAQQAQVYADQLATAAGIDELLEAIASFHCAVAAASGGDGGAELGRSRRERYVFTRRTLLAMMSICATRVARGMPAEQAAVEALETVYLARAQPGPDRQALRTALRTVKIGR